MHVHMHTRMQAHMHMHVHAHMHMQTEETIKYSRVRKTDCMHTHICTCKYTHAHALELAQYVCVVTFGYDYFDKNVRRNRFLEMSFLSVSI